MPGIYDDDFNEEETAALGDNTPPPAEGGDVAPAATAPTPAAAHDPAAQPAAPAAPAAPALPVDPAAPAAPAAPVGDDRFRQFAEQHQGKSPEELMQLAYSQSSRANRTAFEARQARDTATAVGTRAAEVLASRKADIDARRKQFDADLEADPDAATKRLAHERFDAEERAAEVEAQTVQHETRIGEAVEFASQYIPDFADRAPSLQQFGIEMGYSPDEVRGISDGRDIVMLNLASMAGRLIKAGVMDTRGNLIGTTEPQVQATDPRLTSPKPVQTLSSAPGRTTGAAPTPEQAMSDLLNLSDAEFAKLTDEDLARLTG